MFRSLHRAQEREYRATIAKACFAHALSAGDVSLCLYDVTTLYFEAETEDVDVGGKTGLRKVGYSKERRVDPQVVVGLLVDDVTLRPSRVILIPPRPRVALPSGCPFFTYSPPDPLS